MIQKNSSKLILYFIRNCHFGQIYPVSFLFSIWATMGFKIFCNFTKTHPISHKVNLEKTATVLFKIWDIWDILFGNTLMLKTYMSWTSVWIYLKSQIKFWNLKIWSRSENILSFVIQRWTPQSEKLSNFKTWFEISNTFKWIFKRHIEVLGQHLWIPPLQYSALESHSCQ